MRRFEAMGYGPVSFGGVETTWWGGFEQTVVHAPERPPIGTVPPGIIETDGEVERPDADAVYSSSITRPMCACKMLGQGCSIPQEGAPAGGRPSAPSEGPSTLAVVGSLGVVGVLGLLVTGVL